MTKTRKSRTSANSTDKMVVLHLPQHLRDKAHELARFNDRPMKLFLEYALCEWLTKQPAPRWEQYEPPRHVILKMMEEDIERRKKRAERASKRAREAAGIIDPKE
jgi:hypothetical protein